MVTVRIWDLPTRLFHWSLVLCVAGLIVTGNVGGNAMVWHFRLGYAVLTLLLFRLVWAWIGGHWSRWQQLILSPRQALAALRGTWTPEGWAGHNPLGSWSVLLMLGWLLLQVGTGLVSDDEIANAGPLSALVSSATVSAATVWHKGLGKLFVLLLIVMHVAAIVWYRLRKQEDLVAPMLHGNKQCPESVSPSLDGPRQRALALAVLLLCALFVRWVVSLGGF